jgi:hypothetical protein
MTDIDPHVAEEMLRGLLYAARRGEPSPYDRAKKASDGWRVLTAAGVPSRTIADAHRPNLQPTKCLDAAKRWGAEKVPAPDWSTETSMARPRPSGTLVLGGALGVGKTVAAAVLASMRVNAGYRAGAWISCRGLIYRSCWTRKDYTRGQESLDELYVLAEKAPFLVLDDVGGEGSRLAAADEWVAGIVALRHEDGLPTCLTTNLPPVKEGLGNLLGLRVLDRIADDGETVWDNGGSLRRQGNSTASPDDRIQAARRLVELVDMLGTGMGTLPLDTGGLPRVEAIAQLGRLLKINRNAALKLARKVAEDWERGAALLAEYVPRLTASKQM